MSKKKKKALKREKLKTWSIYTNGSTLSGNFNNVPVYELIKVLEGFIPREIEEERLERIKRCVSSCFSSEAFITLVNANFNKENSEVISKLIDEINSDE